MRAQRCLPADGAHGPCFQLQSLKTLSFSLWENEQTEQGSQVLAHFKHHHCSDSMSAGWGGYTCFSPGVSEILGRGHLLEGGGARVTLIPTLPKAILSHVCAFETWSENVSFTSYCSLWGTCSFPIRGTWDNF